MKTKVLILVTLLTLALTLTSYAEIPHLINYQGKATDAQGAPLNDDYNITIRIYNHLTAGDLLWNETHSGVTITNGVFNILLGDVTPLDLPFDEDCWIGIEINTDGEMTPRTRISSVGYAYRAENANYAVIAGTAEDIDTDNVIDAKGGLVIETRDSDPDNPVTGQIWLRTDL